MESHIDGVQSIIGPPIQAGHLLTKRNAYTQIPQPSVVSRPRFGYALCVDMFGTLVYTVDKRI